jgi:hypothetical protein
MNERGKSDSLIVPGKLPNKGCGVLRPAEGVKGRGLAKGNPDQQTRSRTQSRRDLQHALERIRQAARKDKKLVFIVLRHTIRKRLRAKLGELKRELRRRMHVPVPEVGRWLRTVLLGHYRYYGVPYNGRALNTFRFYVCRLWFRTLRRRSQRTLCNREWMSRVIKRWLPFPRIVQPHPVQHLRVFT